MTPVQKFELLFVTAHLKVPVKSAPILIPRYLVEYPSETFLTVVYSYNIFY